MLIQIGVSLLEKEVLYYLQVSNYSYLFSVFSFLSEEIELRAFNQYFFQYEYISEIHENLLDKKHIYVFYR